MQEQFLISGWTAMAALSYVLLIASMSMRRMLPLRLLAIGSGAAGTLYFWFHLHDWVTSSWELAFVLVNLVQVGVLLNERFHNARTPDEERLRKSVFSDLDDREFSALMRIAEWHDMPAGAKLTREGQPVARLMLLIEGAVQVEINDVVVAVCRDSDFVGELSFLSNAVASATTVALSHGRYISFDAQDLRALVERERGLERMMQRLLNVNLVAKLRATSRASI